MEAHYVNANAGSEEAACYVCCHACGSGIGPL